MTAYRVAAPAYYQRALSAVGARNFSGRFNPVGVSVLYFSLEHATAVEEYFGTEPPAPAVLLPVTLHVKSLVDLRGSAKGWPSVWKDWDCDWKVARDAWAAGDLTADCASWRCGREVIKRNCSGVIFPSTKSSGINVAVFPEDAIFGNCQIIPIDPKGTIAAVHPPVRKK